MKSGAICSFLYKVCRIDYRKKEPDTEVPGKSSLLSDLQVNHLFYQTCTLTL